jgi:hypothetical protein
MTGKYTRLSFETNTTTDENTGEVLSVYFQLRRGKVSQTIEFENGAAFADYNARGELLGVELLSPCRVTIIDKIAANEPVSLRKSMKAFVRRSGPREMVAA